MFYPVLTSSQACMSRCFHYPPRHDQAHSPASIRPFLRISVHLLCGGAREKTGWTRVRNLTPRLEFASPRPRSGTDGHDAPEPTPPLRCARATRSAFEMGTNLAVVEQDRLPFPPPSNSRLPQIPEKTNKPKKENGSVGFAPLIEALASVSAAWRTEWFLSAQK